MTFGTATVNEFISKRSPYCCPVAEYIFSKVLDFIRRLCRAHHLVCVCIKCFADIIALGIKQMPEFIFDIVFFVKHLGCCGINILHQMVFVSTKDGFIQVICAILDPCGSIAADEDLSECFCIIVVVDKSLHFWPKFTITFFSGVKTAEVVFIDQLFSAVYIRDIPLVFVDIDQLGNKAGVFIFIGTPVLLGYMILIGLDVEIRHRFWFIIYGVRYFISYRMNFVHHGSFGYFLFWRKYSCSLRITGF